MVVSVVVLLLSGTGSVRGEERPVAKQAAQPTIVRLEPREFPGMPPAVADDLQRRGCTIPQTYVKRLPHNVISGRFRDRAEVDWAVLCSRQGRSTILIYWSGSAGDVATLGEAADATYVQYVGEGRSGYSRFIATASPEMIEHNCRVSEAPAPKCPRIAHDGIDDGFTEKGSRVLYFDGGRWHDLPGAD
jgi:hypothetical protein